MSEIAMSEISTVHENTPTQPPAATRRRRYRRPLLRRSGGPSQRDLSIFKKIEFEKLTHEEVAAKFDLHRSRVTQIYHNVRRYLAQATADDPDIENHLARQRLEVELEKLRLEFALDAAAAAMGRQRPNFVTHRSGSRTKNEQREEWSEMTRREIPINMQPIKTFLRVTRELGKLNQRQVESNLVGQQLTQRQMFRAIGDVLRQWLDRAPSQTDCPSRAFLEMVAHFEFSLRQWGHYCHMGYSPAEAWPPPAAQDADEQREESGCGESDEVANPPAPQINGELTSGSAIWDASTSNAPTT